MNPNNLNLLPEPSKGALADVQFTSVRVPWQNNYVFPVKCMVCGKPADPKLTYKISFQNYSPNLFTAGRRYVIEFPICNECEQLVRFSRKKSHAGCLPAGLIGIAVFVGIYFLTHFGLLSAMFFGFLAIILGWILFSWISDRRIPPETMTRYRKLILAAKITRLIPALQEEDVRIEIRFLSEEYARQFASLNKGEVI